MHLSMEECATAILKHKTVDSPSDTRHFRVADMQEDIWRNLPKDVLERTFPWLPVRTLLRIRTVCKDWHSIISAKDFRDLYAGIFLHQPWLLLFPKDDSTSLAFDPSSSKWMNLQFSFLPLNSRVVASSHGLACAIPKCGQSGIIYVCNPILRTWREISRPLILSRLSFLVVGMIVDKVPSPSPAFKIIVAGSELISQDSSIFSLTAEVFDSESWSWSKAGSISIESPINARKTFSNGVMYCLTRTRPLTVLGYTIAKALWFKIDAIMPQNMTSVMLIDHRGRLNMVGGIRIATPAAMNEICIWELREKGMEWVEVERMPMQFCSELLMSSSSKRFTCVGDGDLIYFSSKWCLRILLFDFLRRTWRWLPPCPQLPNPHYSMLYGLSFDPRLDV